MSHSVSCPSLEDIALVKSVGMVHLITGLSVLASSLTVQDFVFNGKTICHTTRTSSEALEGRRNRNLRRGKPHGDERGTWQETPHLVVVLGTSVF
jgi:hypothetical protein